MSDAAQIIASKVEEVVDSKVAKASRGGTTSVQAVYKGEDAQGKPWVLIAGADEPTPVRRMSVQAEVGDTVTVTVGNGMAVVDSNVSNPSASASNVERVDGKATVAQETAVEAIDYAVQASTAASNAQASADVAGQAARNAQASADSAQADATRANAAANAAVADAATARTAAESAQEDADTAMLAAQKATYGLSDVEKVVGTLNWIAEHGEYVLTTDTAVDASKVYYTRSGTSPDYVYTVVADPKASELPTYYELDLDESVQQYIAAHLWLDNYGLNLSVDSANGYRIHQGTVDGTKTAGMYVLDANGSIVAQFGAGGAVIGKADSTHVVIDADSMDIVDGSSNVLATFGESSRIGDSTVGNSLTMTARGLILNSGQGLDWRIFDITDLRDPVTGRYDYFEQSHLEVSTTGITLTTKPDDVLSIEMETYPDDYGGDIDFSVRRNLSNGEVYVENIMYLSTETGQYKYFGIDTDIYVNCRMTDPYKTTYLRFGTNAWPDMYVPEATVMPAGMSVAMGVEAYATGESSFAFGNEVEANGNVSFAEGCSTANGSYSHSEGEATAIGNYSHAEGQWTRSEGVRSHAEGGPPSSQIGKTIASGLASHAEGYSTASGDYSHAQGSGTIASKYSQTVLGAYNIEDTTSGMYSGYLVIVGNGRASGSSRSNALTVDWSGNVEAAGNVTAVNGNFSGNVTVGGVSMANVALKNVTNIWTAYQNQKFSGNKGWRLTDTVMDLTDDTNGFNSGTRYQEWLSYDKNDYIAGGVSNTVAASGSVQTMLRCRNYATGTTTATDNVLTLAVAKDGTRSVSVSDAAVWRSALGTNNAANITTGTLPVARGGTGKTSGAFHSCTQLYNSASGSNGTITLSAAVTGFDYLAVWTIDNNSANPQIWWIATRKANTTSSVLHVEVSSNTGTLFRRTRYAISGTSMTPSIGNYIQNTAPSTWSSGTAGTNYVKVTRVMGYVI